MLPHEESFARQLHGPASVSGFRFQGVVCRAQGFRVYLAQLPRPQHTCGARCVQNIPRADWLVSSISWAKPRPTPFNMLFPLQMKINEIFLVGRRPSTTTSARPTTALAARSRSSPTSFLTLSFLTRSCFGGRTYIRQHSLRWVILNCLGGSEQVVPSPSPSPASQPQ